MTDKKDSLKMIREGDYIAEVSVELICDEPKCLAFESGCKDFIRIEG